ncbi:hypothetical protein [Pedobacter sp.]|jgi:hypothetical protein|uniref:hypothetical protein n=1 Tax=Pedobacter sp. TaxID=1411316 RepID=UPI002CA67F4C|nr:hypothetical protein [Pedobacter sp.]HWW40039.1 hypothetical protein [Pedobacter sp.]
MPILIEHYQEHKQRDANISVMRFLSLHYWGEDLNDDDQEQDMKLPFKKVDSSFSQPAIPSAKTRFNKPHTFSIDNVKPIFRDCAFLQPSLESLFRPPQV